jgi:hypothetical protein
MEIIAILIAGLVGWQNGTFGKRDIQIIALVVVGWTAVTTAAQVPYLTLEGLVLDLFLHTVVVAVPYAVGALANRLARRRR